MQDELHDRQAARAADRAWELLGMRERSDEQSDEMFLAAAAACWHRACAGEEIETLRARLLLARVCAAIGATDLAIHHAHEVREACERAGDSGAEHAMALAILAGAYGEEGNEERSTLYRTLAERAAAAIPNERDRRAFLADLDARP